MFIEQKLGTRHYAKCNRVQRWNKTWILPKVPTGQAWIKEIVKIMELSFKKNFLIRRARTGPWKRPVCKEWEEKEESEKEQWEIQKRRIPTVNSPLGPGFIHSSHDMTGLVLNSRTQGDKTGLGLQESVPTRSLTVSVRNSYRPGGKQLPRTSPACGLTKSQLLQRLAKSSQHPVTCSGLHGDCL